MIDIRHYVSLDILLQRIVLYLVFNKCISEKNSLLDYQKRAKQRIGDCRQGSIETDFALDRLYKCDTRSKLWLQIIVAVPGSEKP